MIKLDVFIIIYINDTLIFTKNISHSHVKSLLQVFKKLQKYCQFGNLKKSCIYQKKVCFGGYVVFIQIIRNIEENINNVKLQPELKTIKNIYIFIKFAIFYQYFIKIFSKFTTQLTLIVKISFEQANCLLSTSIHNKKVVINNSRNNRKLPKFDFTKFIHKIEKSRFITLDTK